MLEIPLQNYSSYTQQVTLDDEQYIFGFNWNTRDEAYYLSITKNGIVLLSSIKIVVNWEILHSYTNPELPQGQLLVVDQEIGTDAYEKEDLGVRLKLIYVPVES